MSYTYPVKSTGCGAGGSALRLGRRGRWFESNHPDQRCGRSSMVEH